MTPRLASSIVGAAVFLLAAARLPLQATTPSQDPKPAAQEPQYINQFLEIGPDGTLIPLENVKLTHESKTKNHFISVSSTGDMFAVSPVSTVRVPPTAHFITKVPFGYESIDPSTVIILKPFVVQKDKRTLPMSTAKAGMFQGVKSQTAADTSIPLTFKKYGTSSLEIIPAKPLPPGEYEFGANGPAGVFCFGVDAK